MADYISTSRHADSPRIVASKSIVAPVDGTHTCIRIPHRAMVTRVWTDVTTAFGSAGAVLTIGFVGNGETADPDAFMGTAATQPNLVAMRSSSEDNNPASQGKYFADAGGLITATTDDNGSTAGNFAVFAEYYVVY